MVSGSLAEAAFGEPAVDKLGVAAAAKFEGVGRPNFHGMRFGAAGNAQVENCAGEDPSFGHGLSAGRAGRAGLKNVQGSASDDFAIIVAQVNFQLAQNDFGDAFDVAGGKV